MTRTRVTTQLHIKLAIPSGRRRHGTIAFVTWALILGLPACGSDRAAADDTESGSTSATAGGTTSATAGGSTSATGEHVDDRCTSGDCCDAATGTYRSAGTTCRPATGDCDVSEVCSGDSATCPMDGHQESGTSCAGGVCQDGGCQTGGTGSVNWLDPLGYTKPAFYPIAVPAPGANQYWVDLASGSGTACTATAPCGWETVEGKPGTHGDGGGATIYIKNDGPIGSPTLYGEAGNEVVIRPYDDATPATITGRNNWSTRIQHVIFDGGPNLQIQFRNTADSEFDPSIYFNADTPGLQSHITFYRTQWTVVGMGEYIAQWGIVDNLRIVNSEFQSGQSTDPSNQHHIYFSGASNYGPSAHIYLRNNIFRDTPGEEIEFRMFQTMDDVLIDGNAFHNIGKGTCDSGWKCRPAITLASESASVTNIQISNNLIWDIGEGAIRLWAGDALVYGNSVWQWGQGSPANGGYGQWAFYGYSNDGGGTIRDNIIYATGATMNGYPLIPFDDSPFTKEKNACADAALAGCGVSFAPSGPNQTVVSLSPSTSGFMLLNGTSSTAYHTGVTLPSLVTSYLGNVRTPPYDVGACSL